MVFIPGRMLHKCIMVVEAILSTTICFELNSLIEWMDLVDLVILEGLLESLKDY